MTELLDYLPLLILTIAVEAAVAWPLAGRRRKTVLRDLVFLNLVSHPVATVAVQQGADWFMAEAAVIALEATGYALVTRLPWPHAWLLGGACNLVTAAIALLFL